MLVLLIIIILISCGVYFIYQQAKIIRPDLQAVTSKISSAAISTASSSINELISHCNKEQATVNMPTLPTCIIKGLKGLGIAAAEAKSVLNSELSKNGENLDSLVKSSSFWSNAWDRYYGLK